ncbi:gamma-glutamylcyclotransferase [Chryseobacterium ginsengisoli]|uniref:Gamma-glutamylcyclotransferase n=1 Tax=Chryseobacterium ginsengisoli TaxID=363853 RepID=A0ABP9LU07_9FLAO
MGITRGSEWRKWDLHLHTPYTFLNRYKCEEAEFIEKLKNENISCIGLTNYFKFDDREFELKDKLEKEGIITFLNLEIRLDYQNKDDDCLDLHVIFSNDVTKENIEKFLHNMNVNISGNDKKCIDLTEKSDFENAVINFDKLKECLEEESIGLRGKYLIGFLSRGKGNARTSTNYEKLTKYADILIHSTDNPKNIEEDSKFWLSYKRPLLQNSDAHSLDSIGKKFTWIKAETTFEGLKQIIYEPDERIRIQTDEPESEKLDNLMIEEISFQSSDNKFTPEIIRFNKNLNVIIGGKSSGKSILLYKIARTLNAEVLLNTADEDLLKNNILKYKDTDDNKFKDLYDLSESDSHFNFKVKLFSGSEQSIIDRPDHSSILPSIKYIPQNHLSNLVDKSRKNGNTLKKLIRDLILEDSEYKKKYNDFVDKAIRNDYQREQDVDYYFSLKDAIKKKQEELLTRGDTKALEEGIASNKKKLEQLSIAFKPEESEEYKNLNERINHLNIEEGKINSDFDKIKTFNDEIKSVLSSFVNRKRLLGESLEIEIIKTDFLHKYNFIDDSLNSVNEIENEIKKNEEGIFIQENIFKTNLLRIREEQNDIKNRLRPFIEKLDNQKQIETIQTSISEDQKKLSEIQQFKKEIEDNIVVLNEQKEKIFSEFEKNFELYAKILEELKPRIMLLEGQDDKVDIIGSVKYNYPEFRKMVDSIIDGRSFNNEGFEYLYQYEKTSGVKTALSEVDFSSIKNGLKNLFEKIENNPGILKGNNSERDACKKILTDNFFDHWDVKSDNDDIHKMSTGKASFVLLKLIIKLSKDNGPILIDQPEDNLDNRSVSRELVEYLKLRKRERQIILVTHNPNIVVNADAENVIVANQNGQNDTDSESPYKFDYINGALEDSFSHEDCKDLLKSMGIRQHITEIVEGGMDAFKKREEKYGF